MLTIINVIIIIFNYHLFHTKSLALAYCSPGKQLKYQVRRVEKVAFNCPVNVKRQTGAQQH